MNIGQVSSATSIPERMIRHYERIGLLPVPRRSAGRFREYGDEDVARLRIVSAARDVGFGTERIGVLLALAEARHRDAVGSEMEELVAEIEAKADALERLRAALKLSA